MAKCPATQQLNQKLTKALSTCTACAPQIEYLESLAATCPEIDEQVKQVRILLDHLQTMVEVGQQGVNDQPESPPPPPMYAA